MPRWNGLQARTPALARRLLFWRAPQGETPMTALKAWACLPALLFAVGCASAPLPTQQMSETQGAIRAADELGAARYPRANLHLKMAKDQARHAELLIRDEQMEEARAVLQRAEADAELALTLAREAQLRSEAREAMNRVDELKRSTGLD
jgi:hypothetical protein